LFERLAEVAVAGFQLLEEALDELRKAALLVALELEVRKSVLVQLEPDLVLPADDPREALDPVISQVA
jgi:hypothetical protein